MTERNALDKLGFSLGKGAVRFKKLDSEKLAALRTLLRQVTAAHCEAGCNWVDVSMSCNGCEVRLDASGIGPAYQATSAPTGFAFVISPDGSGWKARAIQGMRWKSLGWSCAGAVCRVRLDETGVGGV